jgi:hypothetical protein
MELQNHNFLPSRRGSLQKRVRRGLRPCIRTGALSRLGQHALALVLTQTSPHTRPRHARARTSSPSPVCSCWHAFVSNVHAFARLRRLMLRNQTMHVQPRQQPGHIAQSSPSPPRSFFPLFFLQEPPLSPGQHSSGNTRNRKLQGRRGQRTPVLMLTGEGPRTHPWHTRARTATPPLLACP